MFSPGMSMPVDIRGSLAQQDRKLATKNVWDSRGVVAHSDDNQGQPA
jgi:hypothetical protein